MVGRDPLLGDPVAVDAAAERLRDESEVQGAIVTLLEFALGHASPEHRAFVRRRLPALPTVADLVEGIVAAAGRHGPAVEGLRERAAMAMAAFLAMDPSALGLPPSMFRLGDAVWLTPVRPVLS